jgi:vanillate O-demethylase monooxygenase subunit
MRDAECPPLMAAGAGYDGRVDRLSGMTFFAPGFHAGIDDTFAVESHSSRGGECINSARVFHAVTPGKRNETNYFFALGSTEERLVDAFKVSLAPVLDEDVFATEEIEKIVEASEVLPPELMLKSDATAVEGRRILQRMMDLEKSTN